MRTKQAKKIEGETRKTVPPKTNEPAMVFPVIQEEVIVDKQVIETGKVRISKRISEHEELVDVPLFREEVVVERVPVNLFVEEPPPVRQEGDTMIIPVVREEIIIQKKILLVEELRVRKEVIERHEPQTVNVLREEVDITRFAKNKNVDQSNRKG
jgi:uncharacterized protein (TIGR02271 family)